MYATSPLHSINSTYSAMLTEDSRKYWRPDTTVFADYYYHVIQVNVSIFDQYSFTINSSIQICAFMYTPEFDPTNPCLNRWFYDCSRSNGEVRFRNFLNLQQTTFW